MTDITDPALEAYATEHSSPETALLVELAQVTRDFSKQHGMMVGRLEGAFLKMLVAAVGARRVLEIGTFTGYSALSMAEAMPPTGQIVTCEVDRTHAEVAQRFIDRSPHASMIDVRVGPAIDTLRSLDGTFDFVFIDADKASYLQYYELVLPMLSVGGMIAADNVLWSGQVVDDEDHSRDTVALRQFNDFVVADRRVRCVLVPIRDGVMLIRRV